MSKMDVTTSKKVGDEVKEVVVQYDFGDNLAEAVAKFGEEIVFTNARRNMVIGLQGVIRRLIETNKAELAQSTADAYKPGVQMERGKVDPKQRAIAAFRGMTPEERAEFIRELKGLK